jgi:hypothetical protein
VKGASFEVARVARPSAFLFVGVRGSELQLRHNIRRAKRIPFGGLLAEHFLSFQPPLSRPIRIRTSPRRNSPRRESNDSQKNQNHAHTNPQKHHRRNPKTKRFCTTIVPARRTTLVVTLPANQTKPRPPYRHNSQQQEWHRPAPLTAFPTYNVPLQLTRKCFPPRGQPLNDERPTFPPSVALCVPASCPYPAKSRRNIFSSFVGRGFTRDIKERLRQTLLSAAFSPSLPWVGANDAKAPSAGLAPDLS